MDDILFLKGAVALLFLMVAVLAHKLLHTRSVQQRHTNEIDSLDHVVGRLKVCVDSEVHRTYAERAEQQTLLHTLARAVGYEWRAPIPQGWEPVKGRESL